MADSDRTERRLIDTIRKAKSDDAASENRAAAQAVPAPVRTAPKPAAGGAEGAPELKDATQASRRSSPGGATGSRTTSKSSRGAAAAATAPAYQFGRRVWPD